MSGFTVTFRARWDKYSTTHKGYPIYLKVKLKDQKTPSWEHTNIYIENDKQWDDDKKVVKNHPMASLMNISLGNKKQEKMKSLLTLVAEEKQVTKKAVKGKQMPDFFAYCEVVEKNKRRYEREVNNIKKYLKRMPGIHEIDAEWMRGYEKHQREVWKHSKTSIWLTAKWLQKITNKAYKDGYIKAKFIGKELAYEIPERSAYDPVYLVKEQRERLLKGLLEREIANPKLYKTLAYFVFGCYSGLRYSDQVLFNPTTHIRGNMLNLIAKKTDSGVYYPIGITLKKILDIVKEVGPIDFSYQTYLDRLKKIRKHFEIKEHLSTHVARHTFGTYHAEIGTPLDDCAYFMSIDPDTCKIYYHITGKMRTDRNAHLWKL